MDTAGEPCICLDEPAAPETEECIPVAEDDDEKTNSWFGRVSFGIKYVVHAYLSPDPSFSLALSLSISAVLSSFFLLHRYKLYTSTPVGRWFHNKQLKAWKGKGKGRPHCSVPPVMWDDVVRNPTALMLNVHV